MRKSKAYTALLEVMRVGRIDSKKQQDYLFNRLNNGTAEQQAELKDLFLECGPFKVSPEQFRQGLTWAMDQWKTPAGKERKNNPFGEREQYVLQNATCAYLTEYFAANVFTDYKIPVYMFKASDGMSFEYYMSGGKVIIVG